MFPNLNVIFSISQLRLNSLLNSFLLSPLSVPLRYFSGRGKIKSTQSWIMVFNTIWYKKKIYYTYYYCHGKKSNSSLDNLNDAYLKPVAGSSSSSSSSRQSYVGPGLLQKFLPAKVSGYCFFRFRDKSFPGAVVSPTPNPRLYWTADVFSQGCLP
jgi:hypothetical protein